MMNKEITNEKNKNLIGKQFDYLTIIDVPFYKKTGKKEIRHRYVKVRCLCGKEKIIRFDFSPKDGYERSCGCKTIEKTIERSTTHGDHDSPLYFVWRSMKGRCYSTKYPNYIYYGAKNIRVYEDWHDYLKFKEWALGNGYQKGLHIHRKNSLKNYEPENCVFITGSENAKCVHRDRKRNLEILIEKLKLLEEEIKKINQENTNLKLELEIYKLLNESIKSMV